METSTPKLNTVADILATIISVASDEAIRSQPESIALMKDLSTLFLSKPMEDIASRIFTDASAVNQTLMAMFNLYPSGSEEQKAVVAKAVSLVDEFVKAGKIDATDAWLARGYIVYPSGSEEQKAVVAKAVSLVDEFVKAGKLAAADASLARGYNVYPIGSEEQKAVVAKRLSLVDEFVKAGKLDAADASLARGYNVYPSGSEEQKAVVAKQEQLRLLRSSKQMGASPKIDIAGLRAIAKQELARLRAETVGH